MVTGRLGRVAYLIYLMCYRVESRGTWMFGLRLELRTWSLGTGRALRVDVARHTCPAGSVDDFISPEVDFLEDSHPKFMFFSAPSRGISSQSHMFAPVSRVSLARCSEPGLPKRALTGQPANHCGSRLFGWRRTHHRPLRHVCRRVLAISSQLLAVLGHWISLPTLLESRIQALDCAR